MGLINWFKERLKKTKPIVKGEVFKASTKKGQKVIPPKLNRQTKRRLKGYRTGQFTKALREHWAQQNIDKMFQKDLKKYTKAINDIPSSAVEESLKAEIAKGLIEKRKDGRWVVTKKGADKLAQSWQEAA